MEKNSSESEKQRMAAYRRKFEASYKNLSSLTFEMREQLFESFVERQRKNEAQLAADTRRQVEALKPLVGRANEANEELAWAVDAHRDRVVAGNRELIQQADALVNKFIKK